MNTSRTDAQGGPPQRRLFRPERPSGWQEPSLVGSSPHLRNLRSLIAKVAPLNVPVLIVGETGTGKELVARGLHALGPRRSEAFVPVNCAAIPDALVESELFGHERGAFTGAVEHHVGYLEAAHRGTLLLDEIGDMPVAGQAKLLRALESQTFRRLGGSFDICVDVRVISSTNVCPDQAIQKGDLRADLYFRLGVVRIDLPPLRERITDICVLAHHFIEKCSPPDAEPVTISSEALDLLTRHPWPGNVRELENAIRHALALHTGREIRGIDLPPSVRAPTSPAPQGHRQTTLKELERQAILKAIETAAGDAALAARILGIGKTTIYRKLKQWQGNDGASGRRAWAFSQGELPPQCPRRED